MLIRKFFLLFMIFLMTACSLHHNNGDQSHKTYQLTLQEANLWSQLPLKSINREYPNKTGQSLSDSADLGTPRQLHPAFYGCFDWHSSVHGHWMLVKLVKMFPNLNGRDSIIVQLERHLSAENIQGELAFFKRPIESTYERTYGWAWLLKLAEELHTWDSPEARQMERNLQPLTDYIVQKYMSFLPKLQYPVRSGLHTNTAFGLTLAWDYANAVGNDSLKTLIDKRAHDFYMEDKNAPLSWEPSGYDFLSPSLEEADLMLRVLSPKEFSTWLNHFLPQLTNKHFILEPGKVADPSDGLLVHLYGLNFSRAWCLYDIAASSPKYAHLNKIANAHVAYSLPHLVNGEYMGEHWLATFAVYALLRK